MREACLSFKLYTQHIKKCNEISSNTLLFAKKVVLLQPERGSVYWR